MTRPLPDALRAPITDKASAEAWIRALHEHDFAFHFDDDPATIIEGGSGCPLFDGADVPLIKARVAALYQFDWGEYDCPIGFLLFVEGHTFDD